MKASHEILGISPNATEEEIKKAYKKLAKQYHPDLGGSQEKFIELKKARDNLLNPKPITSFFDFINMINGKRWNIERNIKNTKEKNKLILLEKLYREIMVDSYHVKEIHDIIGLEILINHFRKLLDDVIDIKAKVIKPEEMIIKEIKIINIIRDFYGPEYHERKILQTKKLVFNLMNQFHLKFIKKFPIYLQIFLKNKIKEMLSCLENYLEEAKDFKKK